MRYACTAMSESFVDLTYRGLALGQANQADAGSADDRVPRAARADAGRHHDRDRDRRRRARSRRSSPRSTSRSAARERVPGMIVRPKLDADAQQHRGGGARVALPEAAPVAKVEKAPPVADAPARSR